MDNYKNKLYEYTTLEAPYPEGSFLTYDKDMEKEGWNRCWADITIEGIFVVYRRKRKE